MKKILFVCLVLATSAFAQLPSSPSKAELESTIGGMGLSMGEKLSLRNILQAMQEKGDKVKADDSLPDGQKTAKIVQIRQDTLGQTQGILNAAQQQQLSALLLPRQ